MWKVAHSVTTTAGRLGLASLAFTVALPAVGPAQLTCHTDVGITIAPAGPVPIGGTATVMLTLGTGSIQGGSVVTINRVRYELDCSTNDALRIPCTDQGDIFSYLGDSYISSTCAGVTWSSNAPAGGNVPNEIVFTASPPMNFPADASPCTLSFAVGLDNGEATTGSTSDRTPLLAEAVAGFSTVDTDAACDNGLVSAGMDAVGIPLLVPTATPHRRLRLTNPQRGAARGGPADHAARAALR